MSFVIDGKNIYSFVVNTLKTTTNRNYPKNGKMTCKSNILSSKKIFGYSHLIHVYITYIGRALNTCSRHNGRYHRLSANKTKKAFNVHVFYFSKSHF